jgi:hypothetical protein
MANICRDSKVETDMSQRGISRLVLLLSILPIAAAAAEPYVPEVLEPWREWVLYEHPDHACPPSHDAPTRACLWTTALALRVDDTTASFVQRTTSFSELPIRIPGDAGSWPLDVMVDGKPAVVTRDEGWPSVRLEPGKHRIEGYFGWSARPEALAIPATVGLLDLSLNGERVARPQWEGGRLYLGERDGGAETQVEDRLAVRVYRRIHDSVPLRMTTHLDIEVAGRAREVTLGRAQLDGFLSVGLSSPLPARLEANGDLRLFAEPGTWQIELQARYPGPIDTLAPVASTESWPDQEVWVYVADRAQRVASVEGVSAIDASQTGLPAAWRNFPAYLVTPEDTFTLREEQRGDESPAPDVFNLNRDLWLDFAGQGFTVRDRLTGTLSRARRVQSQTTPGRVQVNGTPVLVTRLTPEDPAGVQLPQGSVELLAVSHVPSAGELQAVGWDIDVQQLGSTVHLPPGWELLDASGVDLAHGAWIQKWSLWDVFLVLLLTVATMRLLGRVPGAMMFVALLIGYHVADAPVIIWLFAVGTLALLRVLPAGVLRRITRLTYGGIMVLAAIAVLLFAIDRVRIAIYPQLEQPFRQVGAGMPGLAGDVTVTGGLVSAPNAPAEKEEELLATEMPASSFDNRRRTGEITDYLSRRAADYGRIDAAANVQTGPGEPRWSWKSIALNWSGPVRAGQSLELRLVPPAVMRPLYVLMAALFGVLLIWFILELIPADDRPRWLRRIAGATSPWLVILLLQVPAPADAASEVVVDPSLLRELETRLTAPPECLPGCASVERAQVSLSPTRLRVQLAIHVNERVSVPLPATLQSWNPRTVLVDGYEDAVLGRSTNQELMTVLDAGRHQIVLEGPASGLDRIRLPFTLEPGELRLDVDGWSVGGVVDGRIRGQAIVFERIEEQETERTAANLMPDPVPAFVSVQRILHLGIDWRVETLIRRIVPQRGSINVDVPLIPGESVLSEEIPVSEGVATVIIPPGASSVRWESSLEQGPVIELTAGPMNAYHELWFLDAANLWHVEAEGLPPVKQAAARMPLWQPWPDERLTLTVFRPEGVAGRTRTVETVSLSQRPGGRATDTTLAFMIRASQGSSYPISLPEGAELQSITIDGEEQPIPPDPSELSLPLRPGQQQLQLTWQTGEGIETLWRSPTLTFPTPINNVDMSLQLPRNRWPLAVAGPEIGPAMLFWGVLVVIVGVALALGRFRGVPLPTRDWMLLGIGMSTCNLPSILLAVLWLFALHGRERWGERIEARWQFNLAQLALGFLSVATIIALLSSIPLGLLGSPDMQVVGNGSNDYFYRWYQDRTPGALPSAWLVTAPIWVYRAAMLAWSLWLSFALLRWLRWGWRCFATGGIWRSKSQIVTESPEPSAAS